MANTDKEQKGSNEKKSPPPQGNINPDNNDAKNTFPVETSPNEKLSIPERKLKKDKK